MKNPCSEIALNKSDGTFIPFEIKWSRKVQKLRPVEEYFFVENVFPLDSTNVNYQVCLDIFNRWQINGFQFDEAVRVRAWLIHGLQTYCKKCSSMKNQLEEMLTFLEKEYADRVECK